MATEVAADALRENGRGMWLESVVGITQAFLTNQGVLPLGHVYLLLSKWHFCCRPKQSGERKYKSVQGCIVAVSLSDL